MQFSIRNNLQPNEVEAVLDSVLMLTGEDEAKYYWQGFNDIPKDRGVWAKAGIEYLMAGNAFLELCGSTGIQGCDDMIRQFGAETFRNVFEITKKEVKNVRVYIRQR